MFELSFCGVGMIWTRLGVGGFSGGVGR